MNAGARIGLAALTFCGALVAALLAIFFARAAHWEPALILVAVVGLALALAAYTVVLASRQQTPTFWSNVAASGAVACLISLAALGLIIAVRIALPAGWAGHVRTSALIVWAAAKAGASNEQGYLVARAIVAPDQGCPGATIDGKETPMQVRATSDYGFPVQVCEISYSGNSAAVVGNVELPRLPDNPQRILVIGDTGCRIASETQACERESEWPFRGMAEAAAGLHPDLIIHVGDYHYRERPCIDRAGCGSSPYGDNWDSWNADFFTPAARLLQAAPWIMVRGNHEDCWRAGPGWERLLFPGTWSETQKCLDQEPTYRVNFKGTDLSMLVVDTADTSHNSSAPDTFPKSALSRTWLLTHVPFWSSYGIPPEKEDNQSPEPAYIGKVRDWAAAASNKVTFVLSGHTHMFQLFTAEQPPLQIVAGMGGTLLEPAKQYANVLPAPQPHPLSPSGKNGEVWADREFGFAILSHDDTGPWTLTVYDASGKGRLKCSLPEDGKSPPPANGGQKNQLCGPIG